MKASRKAAKTASAIFKDCLINGQLSEDALKHKVDVLKEKPGMFTKQILLALTKLIERHLQTRQLIIETPFPIGANLESQLKVHFEKLLSKPLTLSVRENKDLIAGLRVINGDNCWENTIASNLQSLKDKFIYE